MRLCMKFKQLIISAIFSVYTMTQLWVFSPRLFTRRVSKAKPYSNPWEMLLGSLAPGPVRRYSLRAHQALN